jgi:hypothetical protein
MMAGRAGRGRHWQVHVFGHTHLPLELTLDGVRYTQWSLGMQASWEAGGGV